MGDTYDVGQNEKMMTIMLNVLLDQNVLSLRLYCLPFGALEGHHPRLQGDAFKVGNLEEEKIYGKTKF